MQYINGNKLIVPMDEYQCISVSGINVISYHNVSFGQELNDNIHRESITESYIERDIQM